MVFAYRLLNVRQWLKNLLIWVPAFFAGVIWNKELIMDLILAFLAFSLVTSAVYLMNDLRDQKTDSIHPIKQKRPIASGKITVQQVLMLMGALLLIAGFLLFQLPLKLIYYVAGYILINITYTFYLAQVAVVDIVLLISGYWIRLVIGGIVAAVPLSIWLLTLTGLMVLYLVLIKRKSMVLWFVENGNRQRQSVILYQKLPFAMVFRILIAGMIGIYSVYIFTVFGWSHPHRSAVVSTLPLFTIWLLRLHHQLQNFPHADPIDALINDPLMVLITLMGVFLFVLTLYV